MLREYLDSLIVIGYAENHIGAVLCTAGKGIGILHVDAVFPQNVQDAEKAPASSGMPTASTGVMEKTYPASLSTHTAW